MADQLVDSVRVTPLMAKVKTMCSMVEPWPDSMTRRTRSCCFSGATRPVRGALEDVLRPQLAVAGPAGGVDERQVVRLGDLAGREEELRLHAQVPRGRAARRGTPGLGIGGDGHGLLAHWGSVAPTRRRSGRVQRTQAVAATADGMARA